MKLLQEVNNWEVIDNLKNGVHVHEFDTNTEYVTDLYYCRFSEILESIEKDCTVYFKVYDND